MIYRVIAALVYALAAGVCIADSTVDAYRAVLCPPNWHWTIAQRYDKRDRFDWIVKRRWIAHCG